MSIKDDLFEVGGFIMFPKMLFYSDKFSPHEKMAIGCVMDHMWKDPKTGEFKEESFPSDTTVSILAKIGRSTVESTRRKVEKLRLFNFDKIGNRRVWKLSHRMYDQLEEDYYDTIHCKNVVSEIFSKHFSDSVQDEEELNDLLDSLPQELQTPVKKTLRLDKQRAYFDDVEYEHESDYSERTVSKTAIKHHLRTYNKMFKHEEKFQFWQFFVLEYYKNTGLEYKFQTKDQLELENTSIEKLNRLRDYIPYWFEYSNSSQADRYVFKSDKTITVLLQQGVDDRFIDYVDRNLWNPRIDVWENIKQLELEKAQLFIESSYNSIRNEETSDALISAHLDLRESSHIEELNCDYSNKCLGSQVVNKKNGKKIAESMMMYYLVEKVQPGSFKALPFKYNAEENEIEWKRSKLIDLFLDKVSK